MSTPQSKERLDLKRKKGKKKHLYIYEDTRNLLIDLSKGQETYDDALYRILTAYRTVAQATNIGYQKRGKLELGKK